MNAEDMKKLRVDPSASHLVGVDQNYTPVLVPRQAVQQPVGGSGGIAGGGGGVTHREIERLRKEIRIDIKKGVCCPPVMLQAPFSANVGGGGLNYSTNLLAVKIEGGATLVIYQTVGAPVVLTVNDFTVTENANGYQDVSIDVSAASSADQEYALVIRNPCGCCVFVGGLTFAQA